LQKTTVVRCSSGCGDQLLGEQAGQERAVHLHHVGQVGVECLVQGVLDHRVAAAEGEDAESAQHVEVALPVVVVEVAALAALVEAIEAERLDDLGELGVEVRACRAKFSP
jgi:hypothetical protein